jgi:hypothetical protein
MKSLNLGKGLHESFARFFEEPSRERFRDLIKNSSGEYPHLDFKSKWPIFTQLARHILALANSGGGCLIIGVEDKTCEPLGIEAIVDKADFRKSLKSYLPRQCLDLVELLDFVFKDSEYPRLIGKKFQVIFVDDDPRSLPFIAIKNGDGIRGNAVYVRFNTSSEEASHEDLQKVLNRRIETGHSSRRELDLQMHLDQLKLLYSFTAPTIPLSISFDAILGGQPNLHFPKEGFAEFIARMILKNKAIIEKALEIEEIRAI